MKFNGVRISLAAVSLAAAFEVHALGLGFSVTGASGDADFDGDYSSSFSTDTRQSAVGFVLDTNVSGNRLFNYRLGVDFGTVNYEDDAGGELEMDEFSISNDFGFGLVRERNLRIWAGPEVRVSYQSGDDSGGDDWWGWGIGLGPVLGVNWNIDQGPSIVAKVGYLHSAYEFERDIFWDYEWYDVTHDSLFFNIGLVFRMRERFANF